MTGRKHTETSIAKMRTYTFNEDAFDIDTKEARYWIGFLIAEVSISEIKTHAKGGTTPYVVLKLKIADLDHLKKYRTFLDSTHPISIYTDKEGHTSCRLGFSARKLAAKLAEFGITPRKSFSAEIGSGLENDRDVWRGLIDGDGSVGKAGDRRLSLCSGSYRLMIQFKAFVEKIIGQSLKSKIRAKNSAYSMTLCGLTAVKVISALYEDCYVALGRKLERASLIMT